MEKDIATRLREFFENEAKSCSMDFGCVTPEYVYRMWGKTVPLEEIEKEMGELRESSVARFQRSSQAYHISSDLKLDSNG